MELLTGKPPYFDLAPMAALFRIVQDDVPPLPPDISPVIAQFQPPFTAVSQALKDFFMKCFKKEPRLRSSAEDLLRHPWISNVPANKLPQVDISQSILYALIFLKGSRNSDLLTRNLTKDDTFQLQLVAEGEKSDSENDDEGNWDIEFELESAHTALSLNPSGNSDNQSFSGESKSTSRTELHFY